LSTATNTNGPPLLLFLTGRGATPPQVRDTLTVCFLAMSVLSGVVLVATRTSGAVPDPGVLAVMVPLVLAGQLAGRPLFARLAAGGRYEGVLTAILVASVVTGLIVQVA
jgi:hypothetical protein